MRKERKTKSFRIDIPYMKRELNNMETGDYNSQFTSNISNSCT